MKGKNIIVAEDSMLRELLLSDGWKVVLEPWLHDRLDAVKDRLLEKLDYDSYLVTVGKAQQIREIVQEVNRRGNRKSDDILEPE
jgi:hypothetical protein